MKMRHCDLCDAASAAVFCPSDDAFLCRSCDAKVHQANFLVARHVRHSFCSDCCDLTGHGVSGETCPSCSPESDGDDSTGYSSDCVSSTTSPATKEHSGGRANRSRQCSGSKRLRRDGGSRRAEGILVEWCGKLGVGADVDVRMACEGLRVSTVLPFRVCLAASMWLGLRRSVATSRVLKRLEEISGVPAKVIIASALKLERGLRGGSRRRLELEEGWAES